MGDEQHKLSSSSPEATGSMIPELWTKLILREQLQPGYFLSHLPPGPPRPPRSRRRRVQLRIKWKVLTLREQTALRLAPWLDRDPYE